MLDFIRKINYHFWRPCLNMFDVLAIITISNLVMNFSIWWFLAYIVIIPVSVRFQLFTERYSNENSSNQRRTS